MATGKELLCDISKIDFNHVIADIAEIRKYNPQRYEMEQLTAIVHEDFERKVCVGYKDISAEEFWIRGHMPNLPLMPGVIMLECAGQLVSYFVQRTNSAGASMVGFGGLEEVRFRDPIIPGDRLILLCELIKARPKRMVISRFQGVVRDALVVEGIIKGIPIPVESLSQQLKAAAE